MYRALISSRQAVLVAVSIAALAALCITHRALAADPPETEAIAVPHEPKDAKATKEVWEMLAQYHAADADFQRSLSSQQKYLQENMTAIAQRVNEAKSKLCDPSNEFLNDQFMCAPKPKEAKK